ncbi:MAG TPA: hypothetical protein VG165_16540 [Solirubrobacteraceae bacterium]|jgi:hypothetical protein|nr:hypothetical protein [Solirubrobacteraceae bacterium]
MPSRDRLLPNARSIEARELHPVRPHSADQAWFWTDRWQVMEREAQADIDAGRTETYPSPEEFIADLDREADDRGLR